MKRHLDDDHHHTGSSSRQAGAVAQQGSSGEECPTKKTRVDFHKTLRIVRHSPQPCCPLARPQEVGQFSVDAERRVHPDARNLKYLQLPPPMVVCDSRQASRGDTVAGGRIDGTSGRGVDGLKMNLSEGYGSWIQRDDVNEKEYIDPILHWIVEGVLDKAESHLPLKSALFNTDFVSWRGLLTKIAATPYENREGWIICAIKLGGVTFLCEFDTPEKQVERATLAGRQREMTYWGYKFEQFVVADTPGGKCDTGVPVNNNEQFCTVVRSKLEDKHRLLFAGEVDCAEPESPQTAGEPNIAPTGSPHQTYVEIKTSRDWDHNRQRDNFYRFKTLKWWLQSYLVGIPRIVCGFRDDSGNVNRIETFHVLHLPKEASTIPNSWTPSTAINFLRDFLDFVCENVIESSNVNSLQVYRLSWQPRQLDVKMDHLDFSNQREEKDELKVFSFLPEWFLKKIHMQLTTGNAT